MKRTLFLTAILVLGVSMPALALNPFYDLPNNKIKAITYSYKDIKNTDEKYPYVEKNISDTRLFVGSLDYSMADGNICTISMNGFKAETGDKIKLGAYYGRPTKAYRWFEYGKFWGVNASSTMGKLNVSAGYDKLYKNIDALENADSYDANNKGIWHMNAKYTFDNGSLGAVVMHSNSTLPQGTTNDGLVVSYSLRGAEQTKPGSWGLWGKYYNQGYGTIVAPPVNSSYSSNGFLGWGTGMNYAISKNIVLGLEYYKLKGKADNTNYRTLWTNFTLAF